MPGLTARSRSRLLGALTTAAATTVLAVSGLAPAEASSPEPPRPAFYQTPAALPSANGALIRQERLTYFLDAANFAGTVADSRRLLYKSTNRAGRAVAVSGLVIVPKAAWTGRGPRPLVSVAAGTQGMADRCAPSRAFGEHFEYEAISILPLLAQGYAVTMTDYEGLGTEGLHTYMDRVAQGHAVLDGVRAAQQVGIGGITAESPVGVQGYSQGGGAAASAAELAPTHAPELKLKGVVASAVPADLNAVAQQVDGSLYASFAYFATAGLAASHGIDTAAHLNDRGQAFLAEIEQDCVSDLFSGSFKNSRQYTRTGESLTQLMAREPFRSVIDHQRLGRLKPTVPVLVTHSTLDDVIPYRVGRTMAKDWCARGAAVKFVPNAVPTHLGGMSAHTAEATVFWSARFAGRTMPSTCGWF